MRSATVFDSSALSAFDRSDSLVKLAPALLLAQIAIDKVAKEADNPYFKSKYADVGAVIGAIKGPLNDQGITFLQFGAPAPEGHLGLTTLLLHESGEYLAGTLTMPLAKADPQGLGSAITYARRYSLQAVLGLIAEDDDAEGAVTHEKPQGKFRVDSKPKTRLFPRKA